MPNGSVVALDIGVLLRLARLDVAQGNAVPFGPFHQLAEKILLLKPVVLRGDYQGAGTRAVQNPAPRTTGT